MGGKIIKTILILVLLISIYTVSEVMLFEKEQAYAEIAVGQLEDSNKSYQLMATKKGVGMLGSLIYIVAISLGGVLLYKTWSKKEKVS